MNLIFVIIPVLAALVNGYMVAEKKKSVSFQGAILLCMIAFTAKSVVEVFSYGELRVSVLPINVMLICMALDNVYNRRSTGFTTAMMVCLVVILFFLRSPLPLSVWANMAIVFATVFARCLPNRKERLHTVIYCGILALLGVVLICNLCIGSLSLLGECKENLCYLELNSERLSNMVIGLLRLLHS